VPCSLANTSFTRGWLPRAFPCELPCVSCRRGRKAETPRSPAHPPQRLAVDEAVIRAVVPQQPQLAWKPPIVAPGLNLRPRAAYQTNWGPDVVRGGRLLAN
jgi:hypothetical protein